MARISRTRVADADTYGTDMPQDVEREVYANGVPDHDEDDVPRRRPASTSRPAVSTGWGAPKQEQRERVQAPYLKLKDNGKRIVKLLTEAPSLRYFEHYVNSSGKRYICPGRDECALCQEGHKAGYRFMFNVVDMEDPSEVATWTFGNEVSQQLQSFAEDEITSPLNRENLYFQVYHIKVDGRKAPGTKVLPLKARDLQLDYSVEPLNGDEIAALSDELYADEILFIWGARKIEEAAADLTPNDLPKK